MILSSSFRLLGSLSLAVSSVLYFLFFSFDVVKMQAQAMTVRNE